MTWIAFAARYLPDLWAERARLAALLTGLADPAEVGQPGQAGAAVRGRCAGSAWSPRSGLPPRQDGSGSR